MINHPGDQNFDDHSSPVLDAGAQGFNAEVPKRKNYRMLVLGGFLLVFLILLMAGGGYALNQYRTKAAAEKAAKEKADKEKATMGRGKRQFGGRDTETGNDAAVAVAAAAAARATAASAPAGAAPIPLVNASAPATQKPPPPPSKPPPPMMVALGPQSSNSNAASNQPAGSPGGGASPADAKPPVATGGAASLVLSPRIGDSSSEPAPKLVQSLAKTEAAGKPATATAQATAAKLGDRSYVIARGGWIPCILETQLNSTIPGSTSCVIPENVYSDDGKVLLIEKGSRAQGSFGGSLKTGDQRIAVAWARIKTVNGLVIDADSPAADGVGTTGAGGYIDNRWVERIGASVLLSLIEDGLAYAIAEKQNSSNTGSSGSSTNVYVPTNSVNASKRLSEKVLDSTINIPPTLYKNRGDRIMIFVNRDLWFDSTYKLIKG